MIYASDGVLSSNTELLTITISCGEDQQIGKYVAIPECGNATKKRCSDLPPFGLLLFLIILKCNETW